MEKSLYESAQSDVKTETATRGSGQAAGRRKKPVDIYVTARASLRYRSRFTREEETSRTGIRKVGQGDSWVEIVSIVMVLTIIVANPYLPYCV